MPVAALIALLPELLATLPKVGTAIYNLLHASRDELPADTLARLDDVKLRQAVEDAEWAADLKAEGTPAVTADAPGPAPDAPAAAPDVAALMAEVSRLTADNQRLADQLAAEQANTAALAGRTPAVTPPPYPGELTGPVPPSDGLLADGEAGLPPAPEPAGP